MHIKITRRNTESKKTKTTVMLVKQVSFMNHDRSAITYIDVYDNKNHTMHPDWDLIEWELWDSGHIVSSWREEIL